MLLCNQQGEERFFTMSKVRPIAIYLPQFHPIPENDEWWGKGFTEWTNVVKSRPRFDDHYQPHLPADFGFYDLRVHQVQIEQAELARQSGIYGFCYYHYWFNGKKLLETPVEQILAAGTPDFPYMLCWANENWTRRWDGAENELLIGQNFSEEDDLAHISYLERFFRDPRYIRVDGKPVFAIYRPALMPDIRATLDLWRKICRQNGVGEIYFLYMQSHGEKRPPEEMGFDASVEFQPNFADFPKQHKLHGRGIRNAISKWKKKRIPPEERDGIFLYDDIVKKFLSEDAVAYKRYPCIFPGWDNSARRKSGATIVHGSTPEKYRRWLHATVERFKPYAKDENFIFINAWNEWAEGNHLEPCVKWGSQYLDATKMVLLNQESVSETNSDGGLCELTKSDGVQLG